MSQHFGMDSFECVLRAAVIYDVGANVHNLTDQSLTVSYQRISGWLGVEFASSAKKVAYNAATPWLLWYQLIKNIWFEGAVYKYFILEHSKINSNYQ